MTGLYLDNVIDERVSEHPVQSDAVTLHQVLENTHTQDDEYVPTVPPLGAQIAPAS